MNGDQSSVTQAKKILSHIPVSSVGALAGVNGGGGGIMSDRFDGMQAWLNDGAQGSGSNWMFSAGDTATDTTSQLIVTPTDDGAAGSIAGRWRRTDKLVDLKFAVDFTKADAAVLFTVPTGYKFRIQRAFWEVTTPWSGGASSTIGLSSSNAAYATKGDLLGAAAGDAAAVLIAASPGPYVGAAGTKTAGAAPVVLVAGNTIRFDRIASVFTAGAGFAHVIAQLIS